MQEMMVLELTHFYNKLVKLKKPEKSSIGGTYYGGTQLIRSVGNHLDYEQKASYTDYGYGSNTNYENAFYVKVGGAYDYPNEWLTELLDNLKRLNGGTYNAETKIGIISTYGTNYSVYGFGKVVH